MVCLLCVSISVQSKFTPLRNPKYATIGTFIRLNGNFPFRLTHFTQCECILYLITYQ